MPCGPRFSVQPRSKFRVLRAREDVKERSNNKEWERFSKNHWLEVNALGEYSLDKEVFDKDRRIDVEKASPKIVINRAKFFSRKEIVMWGLIKIKDDINQPAIIVPRASRFKALVSFRSSSLVGERGENVGVLKKQKYIIRTEYTEVSRVAKKDSKMPKSLDSFESLISNIRSLE
jgi:hypothetical protein